MLDGLRSFLKHHFSGHESPHAMEARAEPPRTAVGKLSKKALQLELAFEVAGKSPK